MFPLLTRYRDYLLRNVALQFRYVKVAREERMYRKEIYAPRATATCQTIRKMSLRNW